ncbi:Ras-related protein Rab-5B [Histomonas meleagridis]|uniref:Ras-related protein Rab-5B n=1 Tax=Histomonas meleagridis TaxID=135588 RepID=UPI00355A8F9B|nr:Ras-related protein Rab-5B [Histomonas meleagridis]KAH0804415.1 Ras-related protein Rab-5B [Histomonas meleagridis]
MESNKEGTHTKVVLCGSSSVGKTTILQRILNKDVHSIPSETMGVGFATVIYRVENTDVALNIWDTAGQEQFRSLVSIYFKNAEIVILTFDITSLKSFEDIRDWMDEVNANCGDEDPYFVLCGNKSDLEDDREISQPEIIEFARSFDMEYFEVSAYANTGIDSIMYHIAKKALDQKVALRNIGDDIHLTPNIKDQEEKSGCC